MVRKTLYNLAGIIALGLGILGIFLPVLPTTPFILLAAFCFSRGSERMHRWLLAQPVFGRLIRDWNEYRAIEPRAKKIATVMIVVGFSLLIAFVKVNLWVRSILVSIGVTVLAFIWTRPSGPRPESSAP